MASTVTTELVAAPLSQEAPAWVLALAANMVPRALTPLATPKHPSQEVQSTMLMANLLALAQELVLGPQAVATTATAQALALAWAQEWALAWAQALVTTVVEWALTHPTTAQVGLLACLLHAHVVSAVPGTGDHSVGKLQDAALATVYAIWLHSIHYTWPVPSSCCMLSVCIENL